MAVEGLKKTLVLGHRNPDTDSICSAICYAGFKHQLTGENYEPCRAGNVNPETQYVLDYFNLKAPRLVENVKTQVKDIEIRKTKGVSRGISLKNAWGLMQENNVVTLPCVTEEGLLEGVITIGDITKSYMNLYDSSIISKGSSSGGNSSNSGNNSGNNGNAGDSGNNSGNNGNTGNNGNNSGSNEKPGDSGNDSGNEETPETKTLVVESQTKLVDLGWSQYVTVAFAKGYSLDDCTLTVDGTDVTSAFTKVDRDGTIAKWEITNLNPAVLAVTGKDGETQIIRLSENENPEAPEVRENTAPAARGIKCLRTWKAQSMGWSFGKSRKSIFWHWQNSTLARHPSPRSRKSFSPG